MPTNSSSRHRKGNQGNHMKRKKIGGNRKGERNGEKSKYTRGNEIEKTNDRDAPKRELGAVGLNSSNGDRQKRCTMCGGCIDRKDKDESMETEPKHIPGFYFDPEKKRYFRITSDSPILKTEPEERQEINCVDCRHAQELKKLGRPSLAKYILSRSCQPAHAHVDNSNLLEHLIRKAKVQTVLDLDPITNNYVMVDKYAVTFIQPDARRQRILTLYEANPPGNKIVQFQDISKDRNNKLSIKHNMSMTKTQNVSALQWSPHLHSSSLYLCSLLGYGNMPGETLMFDVSGRSQRLAARFPVTGHSVWSSDWNRNPLYDNIISIGASRLALTIDVNTRRRVVHVKCDSDVFAQQFAVKSPMLFNGSRDGKVRTCDIRLKCSSFPVICLTRGDHAPITCIRVLNDENYVMTSAMDGSLLMWDIRLSKVVQEYFGHCNEITHGLPFCMDSTNSLLFAAGQDSLTRIWSVRSGDLVHTIPFPTCTSRELSAIPALHYADEWGGPGGKSGLFYGTGDNIKFYEL